MRQDKDAAEIQVALDAKKKAGLQRRHWQLPYIVH